MTTIEPDRLRVKLVQPKFTGDETELDLEDLVEQIVADELDLESVEDESDEE